MNASIKLPANRGFYNYQQVLSHLVSPISEGMQDILTMAPLSFNEHEILLSNSLCRIEMFGDEITK